MFIKNSLAICNALSIVTIFLVTAIYLPTFNMNFYKTEYAKYSIPQRIGVSEIQLMEVTKRLTDYMLGRADDIAITAEVNGVTREFFDERDKAHMIDVKGLFDLARIIFVIALCMVIFTYVMLRNDMLLLCRVSQWSFLSFFALFTAIVGIIALDFNRAFIWFHLIFFNNDLWILDPTVSLLINIVPQEFFVDISIRIGLIFVGLSIGYILCVKAAVYLHHKIQQGKRTTNMTKYTTKCQEDREENHEENRPFDIQECREC